VREVCTTIAAAGHQAVIVGGCVRDVLMGRTPGDWDVASSARPEEVIALFKRTIPQGLQHGTVKVMMGKGKDAEVEVTTFRGEGAYSDGRRPDSVTFGVPLVEDLARRDLTVNAIAYDIAKNEIVDPFGGQADITARRLRAVGNAVDRFTEDGLRPMRVVRFAAQLEFELDRDTAAGIKPALPSLSKVSRERVSEELRKLLKAREPSRGLGPAIDTGIMENILPALAPRIGAYDARDRVEAEDAHLDRMKWLERIDRAHPDVRLAAMFVSLAGDERLADILKQLKFSNDEVDIVLQLLQVVSPRAETTAIEVRKDLARVDANKRELAVRLWESAASDDRTRVELGRKVLADKDPLTTRDLAIKGNDLLQDLQMQPGPALGRILEHLANFVIEDPSRNTREVLLAEAQRLELEVGR
jgi:tRNA nucleotidyltransferase (CCA-adding enzyme)